MIWDDAVDLYLQENTAEGERPSLRYTIDTATGGVEKQQMDGAFAPTWYDDAALYQENRPNLWVESLTRLDRTTGEKEQIASWYNENAENAAKD